MLNDSFFGGANLLYFDCVCKWGAHRNQIQYCISLRKYPQTPAMPANEYIFIDKFFAPCDVATAYEYISRINEYTRWWGNVYKKIKKLNGIPDNHPGVQYAVTIGGFLPYRLTINNELTYIDKPYLIRFRASGDLEGRGAWYFNETEGGTEITFDWRVTANKAAIRWFSFLLKPLFRANHHFCVKEAEKGIRFDLEKNSYRSLVLGKMPGN